jgi:predicted MFS family arabinose efflux permease
MLNLLRSADFARFFTARSISLTGSAMSEVVLPIFVYQRTHSPILVSVITTIAVLPYLAFGVLAGAMGDMLNRRRLMISCDVISAASLAIIPIAAAAHVAILWAIYIGTGISAAASVWFDAGSFGAVPALVGRTNVTAANSLLWTASNISTVLAPALGGLLASGIGAANTVAFDAASFAVSAILLSRITIRSSDADARPRSHDKSPVREVARSMHEGLAYLWRHRLVRTLVLIGAANAVTGGSLIALIVVYAARGLHVPDHGLAIGLLYTAEGAGSVAGSLLLPRLAKRLRPTNATVISLFWAAAAMIAVAFTTRYAIGLVLIFCFNVPYTIVIVNGVSIRQQIVPDHMQSRVNTTARMIAWGGTPVGATFGGLLAASYSIKTTLLICSAPVIFAAAASLVSLSLRHEIAKDVAHAPEDRGATA